MKHRVDDPRFGIIWDVAHPWVAGETVAVTAAAVWPRLHHVQLKDESGTALREPRLLGAGAVPLDRVLAELDDRGYRGALCLEWERAWYPDLPPLAEALVAAQRRLGRHPQSSPSGTPA